MNPNEAIGLLKKGMLCAETLGELYSLMEDYSYQEFMQIYHQLLPQQQAKINAICDRDNHSQLVAVHSALVYSGSRGAGPKLIRGWGSKINNDSVNASDLTG